MDYFIFFMTVLIFLQIIMGIVLFAVVYERKKRTNKNLE